ncbi:MAG: hypothetical protein HDR71_15430 [Lachnospiraceae bacterium]|nr:hypothetical protein [Lachnospiraceae bacterium]
MREAIVIPFNDAPDFSQLSNEDEKYVEWIYDLVLRNKNRAREIYYLLVGFCG